MKNNVSKISKHLLSVALAFAVVAVSVFTAVTGTNLTAGAAVAVTDTWDGTQANAFAGGSGTQADPYIIANAEQLAYLALSTTLDSAGKYYKVVENAVFNMNGMSDITLDSTVGDVKLAAKNSDHNWKSDSAKFSGNFDGNGAIIYNLYSKDGYCGLFTSLNTNNSDKSCTVKNVTVMNSFISGYHYSGGIIGFANGSPGNTVNLESCVVENCYISDNGNANSVCNRTSGALIGTVVHNGGVISNCLVKNNITAATDITGGFIGTSSNYGSSVTIRSSVSIGTLPYSVVSEGSARTIGTKCNQPGDYSGIYTDQTVDAKYTGIKTVGADSMKGASAKANMTELDWSKLIAFDGEYPDLRINHKLSLTQNDAATHKVVCSDCGKSMTETHNFVEDVVAMKKVCDCGYTVSIAEVADSWDGTKATGFESGSGTDTDPYIIANAEQLAYLALSTTLDSAGKYYKVVDNAIFNMNGMQGVDKTSDADTVKNAVKKTGYNWTADGAKFSGNFDGNGVIIYNLYSKGGYCGLFPNMSTNNTDKSCTIKNVTVLSSYISGYHYSGGIVGLASASTTSQKLIFENCAVENCYISDNGSTNPACNRTSGTIVGSVAHNGTTISNCLAKNNITAATDISGGFIGTTSNYAAAMSIKDSVSIGTLPYSTLTAGSTKTIGTKANQPGDYINVYTDKAVDASFTGVKTLTTAQVTGANALNSMKLDFEGTWFANTSTLELQVSHRLEGTPSTADKYAGHTARCTDCGIEGVTVINHTYDDSSVCTVCKFECDHKSADHLKKVEDKDGDCVTAPNTKTICDCGHIDYEYHGTAEGHKLVKTDAVAATCASAGNKAYWTCSVCGKIFLTDDIMAPMNTAVSADDVVIAATGAHVELRDSNGELVYGMDGDKHWTYCEVCQTKITETAHNVIYTIDGANGHSGKCADCLYEVTKDEKHIFGNDNVCDKCNWACPHDASTMTKVDAVKVACSNAGNLEYYKCNVCGLLFKDAAATVPTTEDEVTIPKLNHNYVDVDQDGNPIYRYDDKGHWHECTECGKGDYAEHTIETDSKRYEGVYKWCEDANGYGCGYSTFDYAYANEDESVSIEATTNAFSKDVITDVFEIGKDDSKYDDVKSALGKLNVKNFVAYEISPSENMADGSKALVTIALPKTISGDIAIYYVDLENGTSKMLNTKLIADEKDKVIAASVTTDRLGYFAIAEIGLVIDDGTTNGGNNNYNNGSASSGSGAGTDYRNTSPSTGDSFVPEFIGATMLLGAAVTLSRKAKKYN